MHCAEVYDMLCEENARHAEGLFYSDRFWTVEWQVECRQSQREKLLLFHDESPLKGELIIVTNGLGLIRRCIQIGYKHLNKFSL